MAIVVWVLVALGGVWILIACAGTGPVLAMRNVRLQATKGRDAEALLERVVAAGAVDTPWLSLNAFDPVAAYQVQRMAGIAGLIAWKKRGEQTYVCAYLLVNGNVLLDVVTICEHGMLTTGKSKDSQLLPTPPGSYLQSFTATLAVLYRRHQEGLQTLSRLADMTPLAGEGEFENDFATALERQSEFIRSLTLWPLRMPWWYLVRRGQRHEKTVGQLAKADTF